MDYIKFLRGAVGHQCVFLNFAGGAVLDEQGRILLQRRSDRGTWGFLGGAMELGESAQEGAAREIREESGLSVIPRKLIGIYTKYFDQYPNGDRAQTVTHFFLCEKTGGSLIEKSEETLELRFFEPGHIPSLVNRQHEDMMEDLLSGRFGVFR